MRLQDNIAIVTGGTKGVGRGVAIELARDGAEVFSTGRSADTHESPHQRITGIRCEHGHDDQVAAAFSRIIAERGTVDILVNNVWGGYERMVEATGFTWGKPFWEQPLWRWDSMFTSGVRAHYQAAQLVALDNILV